MSNSDWRLKAKMDSEKHVGGIVGAAAAIGASVIIGGSAPAGAAIAGGPWDQATKDAAIELTGNVYEATTEGSKGWVEGRDAAETEQYPEPEQGEYRDREIESTSADENSQESEAGAGMDGDSGDTDVAESEAGNDSEGGEGVG